MSHCKAYKAYNHLALRLIFITPDCREETFQREIMCGILNAQETDYLLWNIERTVSKIYIPMLLASCMGDKGCRELLKKVKKELLPCLRSFTR